MRKRIVDKPAESRARSDEQWLNLSDIAEVEVTSEDPAFPIESALLPSGQPGWRAREPGQQTVRLLFDSPQKIRRARLVFQEHEQERTQEFVLRWSSDRGQSYRDIVRQQYNFSPPGTVTEREKYNVQLDNVNALELTIVPDISGRSVRASLTELRLA